jgi:hypothetical protein
VLRHLPEAHQNKQAMKLNKQAADTNGRYAFLFAAPMQKRLSFVFANIKAASGIYFEW